MMQKKKLELLLTGIVTSTILFTVPFTVAASGTTTSGNATSEPETAPTTAIETNLTDLTEAFTLPNTDKPCKSGCIHVFTATPGKNIDHTVQVIGGEHTIYLRGTWELNATDDPAFKISNKAKVTLALEKDCDITLNGKDKAFAGLQVENEAQVFIRGLGKLTAIGGSGGGAGIGGGSNDPDIGNITIQSGTVKAQGSGGGAGIGSGFNGGAAKGITIKGGDVTAIGGDGVERKDSDPVPPGPGIGSHLTGGDPDEGLLGNASGSVTVSGGKVSAFGGFSYDSAQRAGGIQAERLASGNGSTVIYTNDAELPGVRNASDLNAIIWEKEDSTATDPKKGTVWGDATLKDPLPEHELQLMGGSSLTIAKGVEFGLNSKIIANSSNKIIDVDKLLGQGEIKADPKGSEPKLEVSLNETDFYEYSVFNENKNQVFSGIDKDYTETVLKYRPFRPNDRYGLLPVTASPWNEPVIKKETATVEKICKAGDYTVTYQRKEDPDPKNKMTISGIKVAQRDLKDPKIKIVIPDQVYTGEAKEPEVSILLDGKPLELEKNEITGKLIDYTLTDWEKNIDVGKATVKIVPEPRGNLVFSEGKELPQEYQIIGVPLDSAEISVEPSSGEYNGSEHVLGKDFEITVSMDGTKLELNKDYEIIIGEGADLTSAGDIVYSIQGIKNYSGSREAKYTINPREITIKPDSMIVKIKDYDGSGEVTIEDVEFDNLVSGEKVKIKSKGIVDANNEGHAGEYETIHFEGAIELEYEDADGNKTPCTNYTVKYDGGEIRLKEKAVINKVTPTLGEGERKLTHKDPYEVNVNGITFDCTVQIERQKGVKYEFKMDGDPEAEDGWIKEINPEDKSMAYAVFRGIGAAVSPEDKHIFYVRSEGSNDVEQVVLDSHEVIFEKLPNPKTPPKPTISYNEEGNPDKKTYTVTMDRLEDNDIEYRIIVPGKEEDGEFGSYGEPYSIESLGDPGTTYVGQVRYKETEVYKASDPVSSEEIKTPPSPLANSGPKYKYTWKRIIPNQSDNIEVPPGLQDVDYTKMDEITADLTRYLSQLGAYQDKDHTAFYDVKIQVITRNEAGKTETREALPGDFEDGGIPVTLPAKNLPSGVVATENQFSAVHMFESNEYAEYSAGDVEICADSEGADVFKGTGKGVTFIVNGASPIGIAWSEAPDEPDNPLDPDDPNNPNNPDDPNNPGGDDNNNQGDGNNNQGDGTGTNNDGTDPNNARATDGTGNGTDQNGTGTNGDGTNAEGKESQSITDALKSAVAALAPKTGDTNSIIMWVVIAVAACAAVIVAIRSKAKNGKKAKASAANKTSASTVKKSTASTAKKSTATTAKKPSSATAKKTTSTTKKSNTGSAKKTTTKK